MPCVAQWNDSEGTSKNSHDDKAKIGFRKKSRMASVWMSCPRSSTRYCVPPKTSLGVLPQIAIALFSPHVKHTEILDRVHSCIVSTTLQRDVKTPQFLWSRSSTISAKAYVPRGSDRHGYVETVIIFIPHRLPQSTFSPCHQHTRD